MQRSEGPAEHPRPTSSGSTQRRSGALLPWARAERARIARRINIEYDLFGETLDVEELGNALRVVGHLADEWDERLQQLLGGRRPLVD